MLPDGHGLMWGYVGQTYFTTTDGGSSWHDIRPTGGGSAVTYSAWLTSDQSGFALTRYVGPFTLIHTADGGRSWQLIQRFPEKR
jgi:photosystem II stability/assembly factor-like uncharacterized protein